MLQRAKKRQAGHAATVGLVLTRRPNIFARLVVQHATNSAFLSAGAACIQSKNTPRIFCGAVLPTFDYMAN